jgi:recombination protein RecR
MYHVLGGVLSAIDGINPEELNIPLLEERIKESKEIEIIIAISATLDGQTTAHYLSKVINRYGNKITKLAHGVPVGGELDYLDDGTIIQALKGRTLFE